MVCKMESTTIICPFKGTNVEIAFYDKWIRRPMQQINGVWTFKKDMRCGKYEYKFIVDGEWVHDENKPTQLNSFGTPNNVMIVGQNTKGSLTCTTSIQDIKTKNMLFIFLKMYLDKI